jgi:hypothetical protein
MELVLVLPIFLLLLFALVEFSMLTAAYARVCSAAQCGARYMSISGKDAAAVGERVSQVLGTNLAANVTIAVQPAEYAGQIGHVHVSVPMKSAAPDLLWFIGFGLTDRHLHSSASMVMERTPPSTTNPSTQTTPPALTQTPQP